MGEHYIALEDCRARVLYRIESRNLSAGVFDGKGGFVGIREKFGDFYCFTEYHWDQGTPFGTVRPIEAMGIELPVEISLQERLGSRCGVCERPARYDKARYDEATKAGLRPGAPGFPEVWRHLDAAGAFVADPEDHSVEPWAVHNDALFAFLKVPSALAGHRSLEEHCLEDGSGEWHRSLLDRLHLHPPTYESPPEADAPEEEAEGRGAQASTSRA